LSPWERAGERATSRKACIGAVKLLGKVAATWRMPPPRPSPRGREQVAAGFAVAGGLKNRLDLQPLISGRLKSKKQPAQPD
ncbi:hypothetical protein M731_11060, partial [Neisseria gonorrhoeae ATL_2011_01-25]